MLLKSFLGFPAGEVVDTFARQTSDAVPTGGCHHHCSAGVQVFIPNVAAITAGPAGCPHALMQSSYARCRKGCSPDNAAYEGFFARLKNELFYSKIWQSTTVEDFVAALESAGTTRRGSKSRSALAARRASKKPRARGLITSPRFHPHPQPSNVAQFSVGAWSEPLGLDQRLRAN